MFTTQRSHQTTARLSRPSRSSRLLHSLNVARSHGARSLELRTLTTLARRSPEWLMQLKAAREAFTEGLDTIDLRHADEILQRA